MSTDNQLIASIKADKYVIKDIFCDDFLFTIPNYQRPYSWEEEHCLQLLDDIHSFAFRNKNFEELPPYFLGSAVVVKKDTSINAKVVDGQQRLTTLTLLLSCLRHSIDEKRRKETISKLIFQEGDELLGTTDNYRLIPRDRDKEFFKKLIQVENGIKDFISDPNQFATQNDAQKQMIRNCTSLLEAFNVKKYNQDSLKTLIQFILQKCVIVIVETTDEDMAFRIFNVLNDRGKDLTIADILKSEILEKISSDNQDNYTKKWEDCESKLGIDRFKDFFSHLRTIHLKRKAEKSVLDEIREHIKPSEYPKEFIDNILIPYTNAFCDIVFTNYKSSSHADEINKILKNLKRVAHNDWLPSAIYFIAKNSALPIELLKFLVQLEKVTLSMEASRYTLNNRLERYAKINFRIESSSVYDKDSEFYLNDKDRDLIINTLRSSDIYGRRLLKPVLAKIEEQMHDSSISISYKELSIEHILPQTPTSKFWLDRFDLKSRNDLTDNLGNLTLISVRKNSQASNFDFDKKLDVYFKSDNRTSNLAMINRLGGKDWNRESIVSRNVELLNLFLTALDLEIYVPEKK